MKKDIRRNEFVAVSQGWYQQIVKGAEGGGVFC
jgi:hypothetical protein